MRKKYLIIFIVAFLMAIVFICLDRDAKKIEADSAIYYTIADNIVSGHGFSDKIVSPYLPTMAREPVYPLFLSGVFYLFGRNILAVQLLQALIYALTCMLIFKIASMLLSKGKLQFRVSMAIALLPVIPSYAPYLLTEVLFTFLLALCVFCLINILKQDKLKWYFFSGIMLGIATLCKAVLMFLFVFLLALTWVHFYRKYKKIISVRSVKACILLLFGYALVVTPWMTRNQLLLDKPSITLRGFNSMYVRAVKVNLSKHELRMYGIYCLSEYLAGKLYPGYNLTSTAGGYFYKPLLQKIKEYSNKGLSQEEADSMFKKEALGLIRSHPVKFVGMGFFEVVKLNSFFHILLLNQEKIKEAIPNKYILPAVRGFLKFLGFFIVIVAFMGMFSLHRFGPEWMILFCVLIYFNMVHFFLDAVGRYAVPIVPYYLLFFALQIDRWKRGRSHDL